MRAQINIAHNYSSSLPMRAKKAIMSNKTSSTSKISLRHIAIFRNVLQSQDKFSVKAARSNDFEMEGAVGKHNSHIAGPQEVLYH